MDLKAFDEAQMSSRQPDKDTLGIRTPTHAAVAAWTTEHQVKQPSLGIGGTVP